MVYIIQLSTGITIATLSYIIVLLACLFGFVVAIYNNIFAIALFHKIVLIVMFLFHHCLCSVLP